MTMQAVRALCSKLRGYSKFICFSGEEQGLLGSAHYARVASFTDEGYGALDVTETAMRLNPNYHTTSDTVGTLTISMIADITRLALASMASLAGREKWFGMGQTREAGAQPVESISVLCAAGARAGFGRLCSSVSAAQVTVACQSCIVCISRTPSCHEQRWYSSEPSANHGRYTQSVSPYTALMHTKVRFDAYKSVGLMYTNVWALGFSY
jgi:hypothetical protein